MSLYVRFEEWAEQFVFRLLRHEPEWSRRHPLRTWFPVVILVCFVFVDNFRPADPRSRMQLTPFEVDTHLTIFSLGYSLIKINHISFFFLLYLFLRRIWGLAGHGRILAFVLALSFFIEFQQGFTSGREARPLDLLPNLIGTALACLYLKDRVRRGRVWTEPSLHPPLQVP